MLPVSKDTLLRVVRRRSCPPTDPLRVIGIDDWAWRRNHRYVSIICNLERRRASPCCRIESLRRPRPGSQLIPPSQSSLVTGVSDTVTIGRDLLTKAETVTVAAIEAGVPNLAEAREIIAEFHLMIRRKTEVNLITWIERARASLVASFASGVTKDEMAVRAAITLFWSNGQTEGQITRLKLVRRQMYGRGKIDLLRARLIGAQ
jgi:transposase